MTLKSFAVVACRLLSIWFFVQATQSFANAISIVIATGSIGVAQRRAGSWVQIALPFAGAPMIYENRSKCPAACGGDG